MADYILQVSVLRLRHILEEKVAKPLNSYILAERENWQVFCHFSKHQDWENLSLPDIYHWPKKKEDKLGMGENWASPESGDIGLG